MDAAHRVATQTTVDDEWFAKWFDSAHYHTLYAHRDEGEAVGLIDRLADRLRLRPGASALDLGCGVGRHARQLAVRGLDVTGLDLSAESIARARLSARDNLRFVRQDMRQPFGAHTFDYVFSLFTSFGYFDGSAENLTVVHNIASALKPGGTLVLDYLNVHHAEAHLMPHEVVERNRGAVYRITRWSDDSHLFKRIVVEDGRGNRPEYVERVAKLTLEDFCFVLAVCGMRVEMVYGDYQLRPFDLEASPRLLLVARLGDALSDGSTGASVSDECG